MCPNVCAGVVGTRRRAQKGRSLAREELGRGSKELWRDRAEVPGLPRHHIMDHLDCRRGAWLPHGSALPEETPLTHISPFAHGAQNGHWTEYRQQGNERSDLRERGGQARSELYPSLLHVTGRMCKAVEKAPTMEIGRGPPTSNLSWTQNGCWLSETKRN